MGEIPGAGDRRDATVVHDGRPARAGEHATQSFLRSSTFLSGWFLLYFAIRQVTMFGQLYVFSVSEIGKTMAAVQRYIVDRGQRPGRSVAGRILGQAYLAIGLVALGFVVLALCP